jgi:hypothetical protein
MNAYRKIAGFLAIGALSCMTLSTAFAQGHSSGGHASSGGGGGGHAHYTSGGHSGYGGSHYGSYAGAYGHGGSYYGHGNSYYGHGAYYGHGGYWGHGGYYGGWGRFYGGFYGPRFGFGWFLPVLPAFYATYWFGGIPYYYANDAYYTWSPNYNGYVMTDPPAGAAPQSGNGSAAPQTGDGTQNGTSNAPPQNAPGDATSGTQGYNDPKNGQTDEQQATDRYQCHQWAVSQSGYDPTQNGAGADSQGNYQRALSACMQGRGYNSGR